MEKLVITTEYALCIHTTFELPEGKTWDDVEEHWVKWGTLNLTFKDGTTKQIEEANADMAEDVDWKRPSSFTIRRCDANGNTDWDSDPLVEE